MRRCHSTLTPAAVHRLALARLQPHLRLPDHGPKCTAHVVLSLVLWAAARATSLAAACAAPWDHVVREVLRQVRRAGVRVRYVLLDRGFYSVAVVRYLQASRTPFVMPVVGRGRPADHPAGPSGTRAFFARRRSGWDEYTLKDRAGRRATVRICVCYRTPPGRLRWHRAGRPRRPRAWVYAVWGLR